MEAEMETKLRLEIEYTSPCIEKIENRVGEFLGSIPWETKPRIWIEIEPVEKEEN